jgi:hypothetical protein
MSFYKLICCMVFCITVFRSCQGRSICLPPAMHVYRAELCRNYTAKNHYCLFVASEMTNSNLFQIQKFPKKPKCIKKAKIGQKSQNWPKKPNFGKFRKFGFLTGLKKNCNLGVKNTVSKTDFLGQKWWLGPQDPSRSFPGL